MSIEFIGSGNTCGVLEPFLAINCHFLRSKESLAIEFRLQVVTMVGRGPGRTLVLAMITLITW